MTTPETTPQATPEKTIDARALLKELQVRYDVFRNYSPLAIGIDRQVLADQPTLEKKALRLAMRSHTMATRYLKEMEKATQRFNLDGTPAGEVSEEQRTHASELLRERFKKQVEQRKAVEAAAKAEQRRTEKLNELAEKFGRKDR